MEIIFQDKRNRDRRKKKWKKKIKTEKCILKTNLF